MPRSVTNTAGWSGQPKHGRISAQILLHDIDRPVKHRQHRSAAGPAATLGFAPPHMQLSERPNAATFGCARKSTMSSDATSARRNPHANFVLNIASSRQACSSPLRPRAWQLAIRAARRRRRTPRARPRSTAGGADRPQTRPDERRGCARQTVAPGRDRTPARRSPTTDTGGHTRTPRTLSVATDRPATSSATTAVAAPADPRSTHRHRDARHCHGQPPTCSAKRRTRSLVGADRLGLQIAGGLLAAPPRQHRVKGRLLEMQRAHTRPEQPGQRAVDIVGAVDAMGLNRLRITRE